MRWQLCEVSLKGASAQQELVFRIWDYFRAVQILTLLTNLKEKASDVWFGQNPTTFSITSIVISKRKSTE